MNYSDVGIKCPYYGKKQEKAHAITCEGPVTGSVTTVTFRGKKEKYLKAHCSKYDSKCPIRMGLNMKYKDGV